jgi:hypothetical protein
LISFKTWTSNDVNRGDIFDKLLTFLAILVMAGVPIFKVVFLHKKRDELENTEVKSKFGSLYERLGHERSKAFANIKQDESARPREEREWSVQTLIRKLGMTRLADVASPDRWLLTEPFIMDLRRLTLALTLVLFIK